ncbi:MAG: O-acetyl-ADP-ribose deacetylase [Planctomycetes bacterium]|nr:O-acetyl-ADP-ribose deacetylase [Planctomycetota bacterium]
MNVKIGKSTLALVRGDITEQEVDVIVNAANSGLMGGGGVDGAIHRVGGPAILEDCKRIRRERGTCPPGEAVITGAGRLKARHVVHTVGPIWEGGGRGESDCLASAYRQSLLRAKEAGARSIAFPSISTGAFGYPVADAARVAIETVAAWLRGDGEERKVVFVLYDERSLDVHRRVLREVVQGGSP